MNSQIGTFALIAVAIEVVAILAALRAIMSSRTPQAAIAWAISLVTFPWITLPLYAVFGRRRFEGYAEAFNRIIRRHRQGIVELTSSVQSARTSLPDHRMQLQKSLEGVVGWPFTRSSDPLLLVNGKSTFDEMLRSISQATTEILLQSYIIRDDAIGARISQALLERAHHGVSVYVLCDAIGSLHLSQSFVDKLTAGGVHWAEFRSTGGRASRLQVNFRNHRKLLIIDGREAFVGGLNIGDEYCGNDPEYGAWRDTHVRFSGAAVYGFQLTFLNDWYWSTGSPPQLVWQPLNSSMGDCAILPIPTGPADAMDSGALIFQSLFEAAETRLWLATPYFIPDQSLSNSLILAALRGVDVRVLVPANSDNRIIGLASRAYFEKLLDAGVKIYLYAPGFMHQKVLLIDDDMSYIGSSNLDPRSLRLNFEANIAVHSTTFAASVESMLKTDLHSSRRVDPRELRARSYTSRLASKICALFSPVL